VEKIEILVVSNVFKTKTDISFLPISADELLDGRIDVEDELGLTEEADGMEIEIETPAEGLITEICPAFEIEPKPTSRARGMKNFITIKNPSSTEL